MFMKNWLYPQDYYYEKVRDSGEHFLVAKIPTAFLSWRQAIIDYSHTKQKTIKKQLWQEGISFLCRNPALVFPYDIGGGDKRIVIYDWHHRVRFSPIFNIKQMPCLVYEIDFFAWLENKTLTRFIEETQNSLNTADDSFFSIAKSKNWGTIPNTINSSWESDFRLIVKDVWDKVNDIYLNKDSN